MASADSAVQEAAAVALGKTGDRKILPLLEALREGSVYVRSLTGGEKETVIVGDKVSEGDKTLVPLFAAYGREPMVGADGKPLLADLSALEEVATGRSLRLAIRPLIDAFSGQNELVEPGSGRAPGRGHQDGQHRRRGRARPARGRPAPRRRDRWVRFALEEARGADSPAPRGPSRARDRGRDPRPARAAPTRSTALRDRGGSRRRPPALAAGGAGRSEAHRALGAPHPAIEIAFQGLSLSSILLLMALGLAIVFGLMGVINMAHGELMALGAYATLRDAGLVRGLLPGRASTTTSWSRCRFAFLVAASARASLLERGVIRFLYGRPLETLLLTWGVSLMIQQGLRLWFGAANVDVTLAPLAVGRRPGHDRRAAAVQPPLHHRPRRGRGGRDVLPALPHRRGPAHPRGDPEPRDGRLPRRAGPVGGRLHLRPRAPGWPGSPAARSPRSATWAPSSVRTTSWTRSWSSSPAASASWPGASSPRSASAVSTRSSSPSLGAVFGKVAHPRPRHPVHPAAAVGALRGQGTLCGRRERWAPRRGRARRWWSCCPALNALPAGSPLRVSDFTLNLFGKFLAYAILALGIDLIWGYTGVLSLGHGVFFGLGAYAMGMHLMLEIGTQSVYGNVLPDFMVWNQVTELPLFWKPFYSGAVHPPRGAGGARARSPTCSATSPFAAASAASTSRSSRRRSPSPPGCSSTATR